MLIILWYEGCGVCKAEAEVLARVKSRYAERGLKLVPLTRYYEEGAERTRKNFLIDSVWKDVYGGLSSIPVAISTGSVERYGGSSTPTFIFIDSDGIVRRNAPTRLTEEEFDRTLGLLQR